MSKVILGGGLSGLSAAYYLSKGNPQHNITLFESSDRLGGWIKSNIQNGIIFEQGPRTIRAKGDLGTNTLNLIEELHLTDDIIPISDDNFVTKNRMIYANGGLHLLPNSLSSLFKVKKPFSKPLVIHLLQDLRAKPKIVQDEPIYDFATRRFGTDVADYLISPLICGICAGNAKEISVKFLMKNLFEYEQIYGSIFKGIVKHILDRKNTLDTYTGQLATRAKNERWNVYYFKNGIEALPKALAVAINKSDKVNIYNNSKCTKLQFSNNNISMEFESGQKHSCSHIISALGAQELASLVKSDNPKLAEMLNKIKSVNVGVVNLQFNGNLIKNPGFGFLVPPKEKLPILGVIFDSCCRSYRNTTVLTVMMGGYWFKKQFGEEPNENLLLNCAVENIRKVMHITEDPVQYKVNILRNCIPQYVVGHQDNILNIEKYMRDHNLPLSLCGSSYYGIGINDIILSARKAVENIIC